MIIKMCNPLYYFIFLYKFGHSSSKIRMNRELHHFLTGINTKQEPAWEYLYKNYYSSLCSYAMQIIKDQELVRDVVEGVIVRLWETKIHFDNLPALHGYLYKAVYNNSLKILRSKNTENQYYTAQKENETIEQEETEEMVIQEEVIRRLRQLIDRMPEKRKEIMLLCMEEKKVKEISQILGISINTVKKHKKEASDAIRQAMPPDMLVLCSFLLPEFPL